MAARQQRRRTAFNSAAYELLETFATAVAEHGIEVKFPLEISKPYQSTDDLIEIFTDYLKGVDGMLKKAAKEALNGAQALSVGH